MKDMRALEPLWALPSSTSGTETPKAAKYLNLDVLIDATGGRTTLFDAFGFSSELVHAGAQMSIGIVCNLENQRSKEERRLKNDNWARQFFVQKFEKLKKHGPDLQNIVYYHSTGSFAPAATHYFVMTAQGGSLQQMGALKDINLDAQHIGRRDNIDDEKLEQYVRIAIKEFVPELASLDRRLLPKTLNVFDFSDRTESNRAARLLDAEMLGGEPQNLCLVTRVGDALQEPFWPEGLGVNRGFLHVLDCADLVQGYATLRREESSGQKLRAANQNSPKYPTAQAVHAEPEESGRKIGRQNSFERRRRASLTSKKGWPAADFALHPVAEALMERREQLFKVAKLVNAQNSSGSLQPPASYDIDPKSRYKQSTLPVELRQPNYI